MNELEIKYNGYNKINANIQTPHRFSTGVIGKIIFMYSSFYIMVVNRKASTHLYKQSPF